MFPSDLFAQLLYGDFIRPSPLRIWTARPFHYPNCQLDRVLLNFIGIVKTSLGGGTTPEFDDRQFPIAGALLNPKLHSSRYPFTSTIASVCQCYTLPNSPTDYIFYRHSWNLLLRCEIFQNK